MAKNHQILGGGKWVKRSLFLVRGFWIGRVRNTETGAVTKVTTREAQKAKADRAIVRWIEAQERREAGEVDPAGADLKAALLEWVRFKNVRPVTRAAYELDAEMYAEKLGEGKRVDDVEAKDIDAFIEKLREDGASHRTMTKHLVALRGFFRWASKRRKYCTANPCDGIKLGRGTKKENIALTTEQTEKLLATAFQKNIVTVQGVSRPRSWEQEYPAPEHFPIALALVSYTGLRRSNIFGLRWRHVDLGKKKISIPGEEMKNHEPHSLPIHPQLEALLRRVLKARGKVEPDALVVGERVQVATWALHGACARAELPVVGWHTLRHTWSTWLAASPACSYNTRRELMAHKAANVTDIYGHSTWEEKVKAIESLPTLLPKGWQLAAERSKLTSA